MSRDTSGEFDWRAQESTVEGLKKLIKGVPDFPIPGILFRDIMPIFGEPSAVQAMVDMMSDHIQQQFPSAQAILGLDARGFLIGPMIAVKLGKAFVPIRKKGKLPGKCVSCHSTKEYGKDVLEMQSAAVRKGQDVVIVDDLLATGGTMASSIKLAEEAGARVLGCVVLIELTDLKGVEKLNTPLQSFIEYD